MPENVAESNFRNQRPMIRSRSFLSANSLLCNILRVTHLIAVFCRPKTGPLTLNHNEFNNLEKQPEKTTNRIDHLNAPKTISVSPGPRRPSAVLSRGLSFSR